MKIEIEQEFSITFSDVLLSFSLRQDQQFRHNRIFFIEIMFPKKATEWP